MPRVKSFDSSLADLRSVYDKFKPGSETELSEGETVEISRSTMMEEIRTALREGLVSSDRVADEIITDILLNSVNPSDRLKAAELIKKSSEAKKGKEVGKPPGEEDIERFCRVLTEVGAIREAIEERREVPTDSEGSVS